MFYDTYHDVELVDDNDNTRNAEWYDFYADLLMEQQEQM